MSKYIAFEVNQSENVFSRGLTRKERRPLATDAVEIRVRYSGVNYKDALATTKNGGVIREYPMIPGIDLAGEIVSSNEAAYPVGQKVIVTGYGLGVTHVGGYSQFQQVPANWVVKMPQTLDEKKAMIFGTAGFTAALAVLSLEEKQYPKDAAIFVTGASGGVGSMAIALLHELGYTNLTAVSRKEAAWLTKIGATNIVTPEQVIPEKIKPLAKQTVHAVIDTVGGSLLSALLPQLQYNGSAFLCGNAGGIKLETTVLPFILRGISVIGIDSVAVPAEQRKVVWDFLTQHQNILDDLRVNEVLLSDLDLVFDTLLSGQHEGRTIVKMEV